MGTASFAHCLDHVFDLQTMLRKSNGWKLLLPQINGCVSGVDLRENPCIFAALEGSGCGEIGRHARFRIWCFGVWVRVPPPALLRGKTGNLIPQ